MNRRQFMTAASAFSMQPIYLYTRASITQLCNSCAASIYTTQRPSYAYARSVAQLLAGTAATESKLKHRRQIGYGWDSDEGAWGLWQCELTALEECLDFIGDRPEFAQRVAEWLWIRRGARWLKFDMPFALRLLYNWDRFACLIARVYYVRYKPLIPKTILGQAKYYKTFYNTSAGKGSVEKYIADYKELIESAA